MEPNWGNRKVISMRGKMVNSQIQSSHSKVSYMSAVGRRLAYLNALETFNMSSYSEEKAILVTHSSSIIECAIN